MFSSVQGVHSIGKGAWRTGVSLVCVGTAAKPALSIVEGAVLSSTARQRSGKGTASQAAKKLCALGPTWEGK